MIKDILSNNIIKLKPDDSVDFALGEMEENRKSVAVVVDNEDNLKGIVVKADIYRFLKESGRYGTYPVELAMTKSVITTSLNDDIVDVAKKLRENDISAVPVIDGTKVIGVVALEDVVDYFIKQ